MTPIHRTFPDTTDNSSVGVLNTSSPLWVGSIRGLHVVFDRELQSKNSRWVLLYIVLKNGPGFYRRSQARANAKKHTKAHAEYQNNLDCYATWRRGVTEEELIGFTKSLEEKDLEAQTEIDQATRLHEQALAKMGKVGRGVREPQGDQPLRQTYCMQCQQLLSSDTNLQCALCSWLACPNCGACGC